MLITVDTSIWVDHFRMPNARLGSLISQRQIVQHPYVTGEIIVGNVSSRENTIWALRALPRLDPVAEDQFHAFLESMQVFGTGIGFVDVHLLAASTQQRAYLWTKDKWLDAQAQRLGFAYAP